jgi:hypothetical protein
MRQTRPLDQRARVVPDQTVRRWHVEHDVDGIDLLGRSRRG